MPVISVWEIHPTLIKNFGVHIHLALLNSFLVQLLYCCYIYQVHLPVLSPLHVFASSNPLTLIKLMYFGILLKAKNRRCKKNEESSCTTGKEHWFTSLFWNKNAESFSYLYCVPLCTKIKGLEEFYPAAQH